MARSRRVQPADRLVGVTGVLLQCEKSSTRRDAGVERLQAPT